MYGIAGFWRGEGDPAARLKLLRNMAGTRGLNQDAPEQKNLLFTGNGAGLSLIPHAASAPHSAVRGTPSAGTEENSKRVLMCSGAIFNFPELRRELNISHAPDAEVLLALYEKYGQDLPEHLNGFFAIAVFDKEKKTFFLARDRFGVKGLFYHTAPDGFSFSSELSALKRLPSFDCSAIRMDSLLEFLAVQYIPFEKTVFTHTFQLLPGHSLLFDAGTNTFSIRRWYRPSFQKRKISYPDACAELRELLTNALERRLQIATSAPGIFLSGGLDSAVIAALAVACKSAGGKVLPAFTASFDTPSYDETRDAASTAEFLRTRSGGRLVHKLTKISPCDFDALKHLTRLAGEPFADASILPVYLLACSARTETAVCLSGEGADELFYGYERYSAMRLFPRMRLFPAKLLAQFIPDCGGERSRTGRLKRFLRTAAEKSPAERYLKLITHDAEEVLNSLLEKAPPFSPLFSLRSSFPSSLPDAAAAAARCDLAAYLPGDVLRKAALCAEASGLELRSPFLDFRVADFAFSLPDSFKLKNFHRKRILADSFSHLLPPGVVQRRKRGFGVPVAEWLRGEWKERLRERLLDGALPANGLFRRDALARLMEEHWERRADHAPLLFSLLMLALFYETNPAPPQ